MKTNYWLKIRRLVPAFLFLWLFAHLRQTSGLDLTWRWFDLYLLFSFFVGAPLFWSELIDLQKKRQAAQRDHIKVAPTPKKATWLDRIFTFGGHLAMNIGLLLLGPGYCLYWAGAWLAKR